jgi:2-polyprenyl-3-methyl-5-hydroxy-6-metoxy-1,4-benzoquinol methylase
MNHPLATAAAEWDRRWQAEDGRADWLEPEREVIAAAERCYAEGGRVALDIGCGVGRHALALAGIGYRVTGIDESGSGLDYAARDAERHGLGIDFRAASMLSLPMADASCDYVLAWNVIYHGDRGVVDRCVAEIARVLKPGGTYQGTMLSKRNGNFGKGREVAPDTFVIDAISDKAHPHFYCDARGLIEIFGGFEMLSLIDRPHRQPGSYHWHLVAIRS